MHLLCNSIFFATWSGYLVFIFITGCSFIQLCRLCSVCCQEGTQIIAEMQCYLFMLIGGMTFLAEMLGEVCGGNIGHCEWSVMYIVCVSLELYEEYDCKIIPTTLFIISGSQCYARAYNIIIDPLTGILRPNNGGLTADLLGSTWMDLLITDKNDVTLQISYLW